MTESSQADGPAVSASEIAFVVGAAVLIGIGLFVLMLWIVTNDWIWFAGVAPITIGGLMLFSPRAGPDRAH
jgi:uncharacterized membrane protein